MESDGLVSLVSELRLGSSFLCLAIHLNLISLLLPLLLLPAKIGNRGIGGYKGTVGRGARVSARENEGNCEGRSG